MSSPSLARQVDFPAPNGTFDADRAIAAVTAFCTTYDVARNTRYTVVPRLDEALRIAALTGPSVASAGPGTIRGYPARAVT